jgi:hypothetical protein
MSVCFECGVLSGRGLCVGPITRPEESYGSVVRLSEIVKPRYLGGPGLRGGVAPVGGGGFKNFEYAVKYVQ